jgi:hypothetical protein
VVESSTEEEFVASKSSVEYNSVGYESSIEDESLTS